MNGQSSRLSILAAVGVCICGLAAMPIESAAEGLGDAVSDAGAAANDVAATASTAFQELTAPLGANADFGGIWAVHTVQNADFDVTFHVDGEAVTGDFVNLQNGTYNGTLSGSVRDGRLRFTWVQPANGNATGTGVLRVHTDNTLGGGLTYKGPGDVQPTYYRWYGTRRSRQITKLRIKPSGATPANTQPANTPPAAPGQAAYSNAVLQYAQSHVGICVNSAFGSDCECTRLVEAALAYAGAWTGDNYVWGDVVSDYKPGDIIQFWDTHFTGPNLTWGVGSAPGSHHTAIIESVNGTRVLLIHQNDGERITHRGVIGGLELDLAWPHTGSFIVYRPRKS